MVLRICAGSSQGNHLENPLAPEAQPGGQGKCKMLCIPAGTICGCWGILSTFMSSKWWGLGALEFSLAAPRPGPWPSKTWRQTWWEKGNLAAKCAQHVELRRPGRPRPTVTMMVTRARTGGCRDRLRGAGTDVCTHRVEVIELQTPAAWKRSESRVYSC